MAMDATRLGNAIADTVLALANGTGLSSSEETALREFWIAVATDIVSEITTHAVTSVDGESIN